MKARLVSRDGDKATVRVMPSWIARLFGARPYLMRCVRQERSSPYDSQRWVTEATRREVPCSVLDALDREEIEEMPMAITKVRR